MYAAGRRRYVKKSYKKGRKGYWKRKVAKVGRVTGPATPRYFKLRRVVNMSSGPAGDITLTVSNNPNAATDWANISGLFDSYRLFAMSIKFIPQLPNNTSSATNYVPFYLVADFDSTLSPITTADGALQYENCKVVNMYRPWKYFVKFPKVSYNAAASTQTILQGGWMDVATATASGGIYGYGSGFSSATSYGNYVVTYYVGARNRR